MMGVSFRVPKKPKVHLKRLGLEAVCGEVTGRVSTGKDVTCIKCLRANKKVGVNDGRTRCRRDGSSGGVARSGEGW